MESNEKERATLESEIVLSKSLKAIVEWADNIAGEWNGDLPGKAEDRAHQAQDIIVKVKELEELINGMENL